MGRWEACSRSVITPSLPARLIAALTLVASLAVASPVGFDVRQHLSTTSRYGAGLELAGGIEEIPPVPSGCEPIHLNLVARHGIRSPTKKRIEELDRLALRLAKQLEDDPEQNAKRPAWLQGFRSPWDGRKVGGELIPQGEEDLYHLGQRLRERWQELFKYDYHPEIYPITATQVPRSAASAIALGLGLFEDRGTLGRGKHRAFSVITDSRKNDIHLRFHESCMAYKESKKLRKPSVQAWQDEVYLKVGAAVSARHALNLTTEDAASLWLLCKQEAAVLDIVDRACGLFNAAEVELLEWADDLQAHHLKGYGATINYRMGVPLLQDVLATMERAISASEGLQFDGAVEVAMLRVAHAETVIPFTCLLGLFLEGPDVKSLQSEEPLQYPLRPPNQRTWKGSLVAPYGANTQLLLYKCPGDFRRTTDRQSSDTTEQIQVDEDSHRKSSEYFVQVLHNEKPVTIPACKGLHFCPFTEFKETVAGPHLRYSFETLCTVEVRTKPPRQSWSREVLQAFASIFRWPWLRSDVYSSQSQICEEL